VQKQDGLYEEMQLGTFWRPPKKLAGEKECDYSTPFPAQDLDFCEHPVT